MTQVKVRCLPKMLRVTHYDRSSPPPSVSFLSLTHLNSSLTATLPRLIHFNALHFHSEKLALEVKVFILSAASSPLPKYYYNVYI